MTKKKQSAEAAVRDIRRRTRRKFSPEEKIRIVLEGLRGEDSVADLCRREGICGQRGDCRISRTTSRPADVTAIALVDNRTPPPPACLSLKIGRSAT